MKYCKIKIQRYNIMAELRKITDQQGNVLALADVNEAYKVGANLINVFQHEQVPFTLTVQAIDNNRRIAMVASSDEMFTTYKNASLRKMAMSTPNAILISYRDFIEPEVYLQNYAEGLMKMKLTPLGIADLPSIVGNNIKAFYENMMAEYKASFDRNAQGGVPTYANNSVCNSFMVRYKGVAADGTPMSVIAGIDYKGVEYYTTASISNAIGGVFGKKNNAGSQKFGHGSPCDVIDWGCFDKFVLYAPSEFENEAAKDFLNYVSSFQMEKNLRNRFYQLKAQRQQMMIRQMNQQSAQLQQMAAQSAQSLIANQQRLTQTLADNSAAMHSMIMDSWNQKMASDSRISQARSEATMGINTYQNSYGQNVGVNVSADHVYQNQYGDVYGVSGNALDQEVLNKINWTELKK